MSEKQEIKKGSVGISNSSHDLLSSLVYEKDKFTQDKPFSSIVEAFRFAFALGYSKNEKSQVWQRKKVLHLDNLLWMSIYTLSKTKFWKKYISWEFDK